MRMKSVRPFPLFLSKAMLSKSASKATSGGTIAGYFDDFDKLVAAVTNLSGKHTAVYFTLNPCSPDIPLYKSNPNELIRAKNTTGDAQITSRRWLLIDFDPQRKTGTSSTDAEKAAAFDRMTTVGKYLTSRGWPRPVSADSGNGYHLLYALDVPNTREVSDAVRSVLKHLAKKFDDASVLIDQSVFNAARITKAYGTRACKGEDTAERPHRDSLIRKVPAEIIAVTLSQLKAIGSDSGVVISAPTNGSKITPAKMEEFLAFYRIEHERMVEDPPSRLKWRIECPWQDEHSDGHPEACVFLTDGVPGFHCFHAHCADRDWKVFRGHLETTLQKKFYFVTNTEVTPPSAAPTSSLMMNTADNTAAASEGPARRRQETDCARPGRNPLHR
jgi:hypothetical protein